MNRRHTRNVQVFALTHIESRLYASCFLYITVPLSTLRILTNYPLQGAGLLFFSCCNSSCAHNSFFDGCLVSSPYTAHFKWTSHHVFYLLYIDSSSPVYYPLIRDAHYPGYFRFGFWRNSGSVEKYINYDFVH